MNAAALRRVSARSSRSATAFSVPATCRSYSVQTKDPQLGDYPQFPDVSRGTLPPTGWWDNQMRRNFGETLHEKDEMFSMWGPDPPKIAPKAALFQFSLAASFFGSVMLFAAAATPEKPVVARQYPYDGLKEELGGLEENQAVALSEGEE